MRRRSRRPGRLAWQESGSGPDIVLLPSFPADSRMHGDLLRHPVGHVVVVDPPGFGRSAPAANAPEPYAVEEFAAAVGRLVDRLGLERPVLVGTGLGGYVALELAARRPRSFAGLVVVGCGPNADPPEKAGMREETAASALKQGTAALAANAPKSLHPKAGPRAQNALRRMIADSDPAGYAAAVRGMARRPAPSATASRVRIPALVMRGRDDPFAPPAAARRLAELLPRGDFLEIPGAHLAPLEYPTAFRRELERFVASVQAGRRAAAGGAA
jgi:pimeloyl-ACP methyl ester carboxylesterase